LVRLRDFLAPILLAFAEMTYREAAVRVVCGCICALLHPTIATVVTTSSARPACSAQLIGVDFDGGDILPVRPAAATSAAECCSICQSNVNCALWTVCFACNLLCAAHSRSIGHGHNVFLSAARSVIGPMATAHTVHTDSVQRVRHSLNVRCQCVCSAWGLCVGCNMCASARLRDHCFLLPMRALVTLLLRLHHTMQCHATQ
jgi:hypothetical protein